jgi:DNA-binding response OmpR family regulator
LILMDCQMPDLDGLAATAEIRRQDAGAHRAVIVALTADVSPEQRRACQEGGMDDFLEKPVRTQTLAALLGRHLGRGDTGATAPGAQPRDGDPDIGAMDLLGADIGPEMTLELAREYVADVEHSLERLGSGRPDVTTVKREAHRLIGGARTLGLARFERLWRMLSDGQRESAGDLDAVLDELRAACGELRGWIESQQEKQNA